MFVGGKSNIRNIYALALLVFLPAAAMLAGPAAGGKSMPPKERQVALRAAIEDLMTTFGDRYPGGREYLTKLANIERRMNEAGQADMDGFQACLLDQQRQKVYGMHQQIESRNRRAIREGRKLYDGHLR